MARGAKTATKETKTAGSSPQDKAEEINLVNAENIGKEEVDGWPAVAPAQEEMPKTAPFRERPRKASSATLMPNRRNEKLTDGMCCPISLELMRDPVICADGHSYERANIEDWFKRSNSSPKTGADLEHKFLIPNVNLRNIIETYVYRKTLSGRR